MYDKTHYSKKKKEVKQKNNNNNTIKKTIKRVIIWTKNIYVVMEKREKLFLSLGHLPNLKKS